MALNRKRSTSNSGVPFGVHRISNMKLNDIWLCMKGNGSVYHHKGKTLIHIQVLWDNVISTGK